MRILGETVRLVLSALIGLYLYDAGLYAAMTTQPFAVPATALVSLQRVLVAPFVPYAALLGAAALPREPHGFAVTFAAWALLAVLYAVLRLRYPRSWASLLLVLYAYGAGIIVQRILIDGFGAFSVSRMR